MEERLRGALIRGVMQAGSVLKKQNGGRRAVWDIERKARDAILREIKATAPALCLWGDREDPESAVSLCPLDSTLNFSREFGEFSVMAAYIEDGRPSFGAVYLPNSEALFTAERGKGARIEGRKVSAGMRTDLSRALVCCGCDCFLQGEAGLSPLALDVISSLSRAGVPWRNSGSAGWDSAALATGRADGFIAPLMESQHAAAYLLMEEAGALVTDGKGEKYTMASRSLVAANRELHGRLLDILGDALF
ncbi:MAG: inositol monophosphatase family protein [Candidatus Micrarchaeota archaeon]